MLKSTEITNFAIPYYSSIIRPGRGYESVYIFASTSRKTGKVEKTWVEAWSGRTAEDLSNWLAEKNVVRLFADDFSLTLKKELLKANIGSSFDNSGDVHKIAQKHRKDLQSAKISALSACPA